VARRTTNSPRIIGVNSAMNKKRRLDSRVIRRMVAKKPIVEFEATINNRVSYFKEGMRAEIIDAVSVGSGVYQIYFNVREFKEFNSRFENQENFGYAVTAEDYRLYPQSSNDFIVSLYFDESEIELNKPFRIIERDEKR